MTAAVRDASDWLCAKLVPLVVILIVAGAPSLYCQQREETSKQANEKIQNLATVARTQPHDVPVGTGDLLHIEVFDVPELTRDVRVSDTGDITYPLIPGRIHADGMTAFQLEEKMQQLLIENGLVTHPQVSVLIKEQNSQPVSIVGAVAKPMVYQIVRPTTLLEVLADAGGISNDAGNVVLVTRKTGATEPGTGSAEAPGAPTDEQTQTITIRLQDLLESGNAAYNISIHGGDVVSVPKGGIVYVTGSGVAQPGGYLLQNHGEQITVLKAVALAHGLTGYAKADSAVIMRSNPVTGQRDVIPVHIKQIENNKAQDVAMNSNDILYIPDSVGKKVLVRGAEAAVGVGTGIAIYRSY